MPCSHAYIVKHILGKICLLTSRRNQRVLKQSYIMRRATFKTPTYKDRVVKQNSFMPGLKIMLMGCKQGLFSMGFCGYLNFCGVYLKEYEALSFLNMQIKKPREQQEYQFNTVHCLGQKSTEGNHQG